MFLAGCECLATNYTCRCGNVDPRFAALQYEYWSFWTGIWGDAQDVANNTRQLHPDRQVNVPAVDGYLVYACFPPETVGFEDGSLVRKFLFKSHPFGS